MTKHQEWLLRVARDASDYLNRLNTGRAVKGMYEGITLARTLAAAVEAVDNDVIHEASKMLEVGRH